MPRAPPTSGRSWSPIACRATAFTNWAWPGWAPTRARRCLTQFQQTHDIGNLFVMDGAAFVSSACQNPTLTIMALAVRSTDYLLGELRRGNV